MDPSPILSIIHTITIGTMINFNGSNYGHGLKNVTCKETFMSDCIEFSKGNKRKEVVDRNANFVLLVI